MKGAVATLECRCTVNSTNAAGSNGPIICSLCAVHWQAWAEDGPAWLDHWRVMMDTIQATAVDVVEQGVCIGYDDPALRDPSAGPETALARRRRAVASRVKAKAGRKTAEGAANGG